MSSEEEREERRHHVSRSRLKSKERDRASRRTDKDTKPSGGGVGSCA